MAATVMDLEMADSGAKAEAIDEGLYSRQLYVMGHEAQRRLAHSDVLVIGLDGVGVETAKNIILAGVRSVTLYDNVPVEWSDLSSQFYLTESDIGRPRAEVSVGKLAELNPYVKLNIFTGEPTEAFLSQFTAIFVSGCPLEQKLYIDDFCHSQGIRFISADAHGVFGSIFCDFGKEFVVHDVDGKEPSRSMVASITQEKNGVVAVTDDSRHNLETGDYVTFTEIKGMDELNEAEPRPVVVTGPFSFTIGDTSGYKNYISGGYAVQVKQPKTLEFKCLRDSITAPGEFMLTDFAKIDRPKLLHLGFRALAQFRSQHFQLPQPGNFSQADELVQIAATINDAAEGDIKVENFDDQSKLLRWLAIGSTAVLNPIAAFLGGVAAQEVLKACSGKFHPIQQWMYFDASECLPDEPLSVEEYQPQSSRYDAQIAVFGQSLQRIVSDQRLFLVGAGAIGCEMLKNWAMMGVGSGDNGLIHVTDMDNIEKSNLNRQFLFRSSDVQKAKSLTAAARVTEMNPALRVKAYENRVGAETESLFNDEFFESLTGVCTALDNVDARLYMDQRCLFYQLPMYESGTLGTKGNTQIVVPHLTENYGASRDPPEKSIPICTLKNFPNAIEHTLQWAREWFEGVFSQTPQEVNKYLTTPDYIQQLKGQQNTLPEMLERLRSSLVTDRPLSFDECVVWARNRFEELFHNNIKQLLHNFPEGTMTSSGTPFWSGPKRAPTPITFDSNDPLHLEFVISAANMRAVNYGLKGRYDQEYFQKVLPNIIVPEFMPKEGVKIAVTENENKEERATGAAEDLDADTVARELPKPSTLAGYRMEAIDFDKDNDRHMEVIVAVSNLRARNYRIPEADLHKSRGIAGNIIPAIATTTALVTGLVCLEFYKVIQKKPLEAYKNGFINLGISFMTFSEPIPPAKTTAVVKGSEWKWTAWDRVDIEGGDMTLKELLKYFEDKFELEVSMLSYGVSILYSFFTNKAKLAERMPLKIADLIKLVAKHDIPPAQKYIILEASCSNEEGDDVEIPTVRFRIR